MAAIVCAILHPAMAHQRRLTIARRNYDRVLRTVNVVREPISVTPRQLRKARHSARLDLYTLERELELPVQALSDMERGAYETAPPPEVVWKWLALCDSPLLAPSGEYLRRARVRAQLEQVDIAGAVGVSQPTVSRMERGVVGVPLSLACKWMAACGVGL